MTRGSFLFGGPGSSSRGTSLRRGVVWRAHSWGAAGASPAFNRRQQPLSIVALRQSEHHCEGEVPLRPGSVHTAFWTLANSTSPPPTGARLFPCCHSQTFWSGTQKNPPRKSLSGCLMPRYLAPHETNCMLNLGSWPKQTMSGGLSGGLGTSFGRFAAGACSDGFAVSGAGRILRLN